MADAGSNLYDELFPPEFKREYPALREKHLGGNLLITSNEPWIPWEIVRPLEHDRRGQALYEDPPLCESYQLARWVAGAAAPAQLALNRAAVIQPEANLLAARRERDYFAALSGAGIAVAAPLQTVAETLASFSAGQTQLYHFACHGNFDLTDPNDSKLKLADGFLTPGQITGDRKSGLLRSRPLVFVNACHAGERGFGLTRLGGWAERFVGAGASAFIGSLWEINDALAARFAAEFYDRFFGLAGHARQPLAAAFRAARLVLKELDPANPTWLAYVLYGNPRAEIA
jgi:CHAT domain-containing protein